MGLALLCEKVRAERFDFSEGELKPYLQLEKIIDACFDVAHRLFGITATEKKGVKAYHPEVRTYEIRDADGTLVALFSVIISRGPPSDPARG